MSGGTPFQSDRFKGQANGMMPRLKRTEPMPHSGATRENAVQFYGDEAILVEELSRFIGTALLAGDAAIVIATKAHRETVSQRLRSRGQDTAKALAQGSYITLDAADTLSKFMRDQWPDAALFGKFFSGLFEQVTSAVQTAHISAFSEMAALLWAQGNTEGAIRLEKLWKNLSASHPVALRCAYPINRRAAHGEGVHSGEAHGDDFLKVCAEHSHVIPAETSSGVSSGVSNDEERLPDVIYLQQRAFVLENEIAERRQVEETLRRAKAELESTIEQRTSVLRQLSVRLLSLQDVERRRIARELHDSLGQYLVGLKLNLDMLRRSPSREDLWPDVDQLMQKCIGEVRTLSYLLHPPTMDAAGFVSAARWFVEGFGQRSGVQVTLDAPEEFGRLPDAVELALFRVLQEALTNVHRHSGASAAHLLIYEDQNRVVLEVKDNGRGMPENVLSQFDETGAGTGVGLGGIRERARELGGKATLQASAQGTLLSFSIPVTGASPK
jgi:signal transduction histidine kinase